MGDIGKREDVSKSTLGGLGQGRDWLGDFVPEQMVNARLVSLRTQITLVDSVKWFAGIGTFAEQLL